MSVSPEADTQPGTEQALIRAEGWKRGEEEGRRDGSPEGRREEEGKSEEERKYEGLGLLNKRSFFSVVHVGSLQSGFQYGWVLLRAPLLIYSQLPSPCVLTRWRKRALVSPSSHKDTNRTVGALHSCPQLNLITPQRPLTQIQSH